MIGGSQSRYRKITGISDIVRAEFVILVLSGAFAATVLTKKGATSPRHGMGVGPVMLGMGPMARVEQRERKLGASNQAPDHRHPARG